MIATMDWFGPVIYEAGMTIFTALLLFGLWWLLK
jgi:hypothetical protein